MRKASVAGLLLLLATILVAQHASGGAVRDYVEYTPKKLGPRVYQITLGVEVGIGEFGFLPRSDTVSGNNLANSGKIYSFTLVP